MDLQVPVWQWAASQAIAVGALCLICFAYSIKRKRTVLFCIGAACLLNTIVNAILLNWVVVAIMTVATTTNFVMCFFEHMRERGKSVNNYLSVSISVGLAAAMTVAICFTAGWWFDYVLLGSSLFITFTSLIHGIHLHRFSCFLYDSLSIVNLVIFNNYIGIVMSAFSIGAVIVFYGRMAFKANKHGA